jgi:hypothetical protein
MTTDTGTTGTTAAEQAVVTAVAAAANQTNLPVEPKVVAAETPAVATTGDGGAVSAVGTATSGTGFAQQLAATATTAAATATAQTQQSTVAGTPTEPVSDATLLSAAQASGAATTSESGGVGATKTAVPLGANKQLAANGKLAAATDKAATTQTTTSPEASTSAHAAAQTAEAAQSPSTVTMASTAAPAQNASVSSAEKSEEAEVASVEKTDLNSKHAEQVSTPELVATHSSTTTSLELTSLSREVTATHANLTQGFSAETGTARESVYSTAGRETFNTLDSATNGTASWVHTSAREAEAGYQDPTLGWVSVKASMSGGTIHASVVPSTAEAAQSLGAHLSGLNTFLQEQNSSVGSLTLESPNGQQGSLSQGSGQGNAQNSGTTEQQATDRASLKQSTSSEEATYDRLNTGAALRIPEGSSISLLA